jgi:cob(I)alamin adenosyltransferase
MLEALDVSIQQIEAQTLRFEGWATPGETVHAAALDLARSVSRRAERRVCLLQKETASVHDLTIRYLNRLSDLLWLMARQEENRPH